MYILSKGRLVFWENTNLNDYLGRDPHGKRVNFNDLKPLTIYDVLFVFPQQIFFASYGSGNWESLGIDAMYGGKLSPLEILERSFEFLQQTPKVVVNVCKSKSPYLIEGARS